MHTHDSGIQVGRRGRVLDRTLRQVTGRTHNRTPTPLPLLPNFGRWFIFANDRL